MALLTASGFDHPLHATHLAFDDVEPLDCVITHGVRQRFKRTRDRERRLSVPRAMDRCAEQEILLSFELMVSRGHIEHSGTVPIWRVWFVGFVISVVGATAMSAAWHAVHDTDPSCVVCNLRHQPLAEVSRDLHVRPVEAPEPAPRPSVSAWVLADPGAQVSTRAPPLS